METEEPRTRVTTAVSCWAAICRQALCFPLDVQGLLDPHGGPELAGKKLDTQRL